MTYQLTEQEWMALAKEFRTDDRSLQEQFDGCRAAITRMCEERDALVNDLQVVERGLAIVTMKLALIGGVMAEIHNRDPE